MGGLIRGLAARWTRGWPGPAPADAVRLTEEIAAQARRAATVHEQIWAIAALVPDAIALSAGDRALSYRQLTRAAERVAAALAAERLRIDRPILVGPGLDHLTLIVAVLGVLRAGRFYVYLHDGYPPERVRDILEDAEPQAALTPDGTLPAIIQAITGRGTEIRALCMAESGARRGAWRRRGTPGGCRADLLAVQFTSGTTGRPKGIEINHQRYLLAAEGSLLAPGDRVAILINFAVGGALIPLMRGATAFLYDPRQASSAALIDWLARRRIQVLAPPVQLFRQILDAIPHPGALADLREVFLFGQAVLAEDVRRFRACFGDSTHLYTLYSTTETFGITRLRIGPELELDEGPVPAGWPVRHKEVSIVDDAGRPLPCGSVGEVAVTSRHLSPGYWRNPQLTAQRFLPVVGQPGMRTYLTGDLGTLDAHGCLRLLGRKDRQVKIRGYRVELEAVEAALASLPWVRQAAVSAREDLGSAPRLVAYVTLQHDQSLTVAALRAALGDRLPGYMVPSRFVFMDAMPFLASLKVDLQGLPHPRADRRYLSTGELPARYPLEARLLECWREVLGFDAIGVRDDFHELGGDSLTAIDLLGRVEALIGRPLPLDAMARITTVEHMCDLISRHAQDTEEPVPSHALTSHEYHLLLTVMAGGELERCSEASLLSAHNTEGAAPPLFWCCNAPAYELQVLAEGLGPDQPLYGMFSGILALSPLPAERLARIAAHYLEEILQIQPQGPYRLGGNCTGAAVMLEVALSLVRRGAHVERLCMMEFFDERLYDFSGDLQLLVGRESHLRVDQSFHWRDQGWTDRFTRMPWVDWLPGPHGEFFAPPHAPALIKHLGAFLARGAPYHPANHRTSRATSFSPAAGVYDNSRGIPPQQLHAAIAEVERALGASRPEQTLDLGCGTGQIASVLAQRGHRVIGIDLSDAMLRVARGNCSGAVDLLVADGRRIPLEDRSLDLCVASKLFLHIADWGKVIDEIERVSRPGGVFAYVNESGFFDNPVRRAFRRHAALRGFRNRFPGPHRPEPVRDRFLADGWEHRLCPASERSWTRQLRHADAFRELAERAFAEFWSIPEPIYDSILTEVGEWIAEQPDAWDGIAEMTPGLRIDIYRAPH